MGIMLPPWWDRCDVSTTSTVFVQVIFLSYRAGAVVLVNCSCLVTEHLSWCFVLVLC